MRVLEESPEPAVLQQQRPPDSPSTPELIDEQLACHHSESSATTTLSFGQKVWAFQLGVVSLVFWIPALYLPLFYISYTGLAREFLTTRHWSVFVWQVPRLLWTQGRAAGTAIWLLLLVGVVVLSCLLIVPLIVTCLCLTTWLTEGSVRRKSCHWLDCLAPVSSGGLVFGLALVTTVPALETLSEAVLDGSTICDIVHNVVGETCLVMHGRLLSGAWFYLAQSIVLQAFCVVTLKWS